MDMLRSIVFFRQKFCPLRVFSVEFGQPGFALPPALTLQLLLEHCASWIQDVDLNKEMPEAKIIGRWVGV